MNVKYLGFSLKELRVLTDVLSAHIENVETDLVDTDCDEKFTDIELHRSLNEEIEAEIMDRVTFQSSRQGQ